MLKPNVNGHDPTVDAEADTLLLWILREQPALTGTRSGRLRPDLPLKQHSLKKA